MFKYSRSSNSLSNGLITLELIYHYAVRNVRAGHQYAVVAIAIAMLQIFTLVVVFYLMFSVLGLRGSAIRGDFLLYLMSGIFVYMTHIKIVSAVTGSDGPSSPMMQHARMNTAIAIFGSVLSALYTQILAMALILFIYDAAFKEITIYRPVAAFAMLLLAGFYGFAVGMVFLAIKPWFPFFVGIAQPLYTRANMIFSGKMFTANSLPSYLLPLFIWNPLFHCIDQARGFVFINYTPHRTSWEYALWVSLTLIALGFIGEFYTRKYASASWGARR
ncbi:ABC transporter permease [Chachezhania antarctica]|uniref:ABC transporter permease n=1 Tax=Chachezhania antarctica TaxID=2340860 RepID=UPI000EB03B1D|nr:ABC transporter permease [Chachezhania antarctica]|tara:strand:+ start:2313 stop:3134 length:822 start_codon:yes stop_codon:yes gene_type:complete